MSQNMNAMFHEMLNHARPPVLVAISVVERQVFGCGHSRSSNYVCLNFLLSKILIRSRRNLNAYYNSLTTLQLPIRQQQHTPLWLLKNLFVSYGTSKWQGTALPKCVTFSLCRYSESLKYRRHKKLRFGNSSKNKKMSAENWSTKKKKGWKKKVGRKKKKKKKKNVDKKIGRKKKLVGKKLVEKIYIYI